VGKTAPADLPREWLIVGQAVKPHGVHGDIVAGIITDFPERLQEGVRIGLGTSDGPEEYYEIFRIRIHKGQWLLSIKDLRDRNLAETWRGKYLFLPAQSRDELPEGYYYEHELAGLQCLSPAGQLLGVVTALDHGPGQTRLVIDHGGQEHLVPWVPEIVKEVDLEAGTMILDPPLGLLDDDLAL
jgi:16S rRNA processing protein RimM